MILKIYDPSTKAMKAVHTFNRSNDNSKKVVSVRDWKQEDIDFAKFPMKFIKSFDNYESKNFLEINAEDVVASDKPTQWFQTSEED